MRLILASAVTPGDIQKFFTGHWKTSVRKGGLMVAESKDYLVELDPKSAVFAVKIEAYDDPSDSEEAVTDDPAKFIVDFLKTGTSGDEVFGKMAGLIRRSGQLRPFELSALLAHLAAEAECGRLAPRSVARAVRRAAALVGGPDLRTASEQAPAEFKEISELREKMKAKGWRTDVDVDDVGLPRMKVDVAGVYEAKVSVHGLMWSFFFQVQGAQDVKKEGVTDDPIEEFRAWRKSDKVQAVRQDVESGRKEVSDTEPMKRAEPSEEPKSRPGPEAEGKTAPPPKKPSSAAE